MRDRKQPTFGNGKICYLEIPANDIAVSAAFYHTVFNWSVGSDNDGNAFFDDGVGEVSGMWVTGRKPADGTGVIISIMVNDLNETISLLNENGGEVLASETGIPGKTKLFRDPAGNIFCLYQHG